LELRRCALVPQPGYLTAEVGVKNQMLSEPQASSIWFRLAKSCQIGEGRSTQKLFLIPFALSRKRNASNFHLRAAKKCKK